MRLNKFIALHTDVSRRNADSLIQNGDVLVNGKPPVLGYDVTDTDIVTVSGKKITLSTTVSPVTILLNKPIGYVCSRNGQGSPTIYDLIPTEYAHLLIAGRLDKDSSGLVVLTNDGDLVQSLTHPSRGKSKEYVVVTDRPLTESDASKLTKGVDIGDNKLSKFTSIIAQDKKQTYTIQLHEGRNRQIRRTLKSLGYNTSALTRTKLGQYTLESIGKKRFLVI